MELTKKTQNKTCWVVHYDCLFLPFSDCQQGRTGTQATFILADDQIQELLCRRFTGITCTTGRQFILAEIRPEQGFEARQVTLFIRLGRRYLSHTVVTVHGHNDVRLTSLSWSCKVVVWHGRAIVLTNNMEHVVTTRMALLC